MKRIVIGISGASGMPIAAQVLQAFAKQTDYYCCLVISNGAKKTIELESDYQVSDLAALADEVFDIQNIGASIASGTYKTEGMIVVPCSMKTVAGIASGYSDNLLLRAADVTIKERRRLVLVARETPYSTIHLKNMLTLSEMGVIIMPPMQTFYNQPKSIADMVHHITGKILDIYGIEYQKFQRWS
jgi:4-hydroxy-3-polyprenylbenzoate decarboxylase